jgi:hypothetical protein
LILRWVLIHGIPLATVTPRAVLAGVSITNVFGTDEEESCFLTLYPDLDIWHLYVKCTYCKLRLR